MLAAVLGALLLAGAALADKEIVRITAAGQAAARAAVLKRSDLGSATGWKGGAKKPAINTGTGCPNFDPKQSDLVLIGAAESDFTHTATGTEFDTIAQVLQTPAMVKKDWQRTVLAPQVAPCLRHNYVKSLGASQKLVSFKRLSFPKVATYTRAYRAVIDVKGSTRTTRFFIDLVFAARGSTELSISSSGLYAAAPAIKAAEIRLARLLVSRIVI